ncbi:DEAD/DEAH box helicase [Ceratobasidium sp. AG-Ba]|nr:DEAD/DEAH box helicase [Ceratobasidium sp. AG-Ba]
MSRASNAPPMTQPTTVPLSADLADTTLPGMPGGMPQDQPQIIHPRPQRTIHIPDSVPSIPTWDDSVDEVDEMTCILQEQGEEVLSDQQAQPPLTFGDQEERVSELLRATLRAFTVYGLDIDANTAYQDGQGRWRNTAGRYISAYEAERLQLQQPTPNPSVSPAPVLCSHTPASGNSSPPSLSALVVSLDTSPAPSSVVFPPSPALDTNLEPEPEAGYTSPYTPRRRVCHSSLPSAPHPPRFAPGSSDKDKDEPDFKQPSPTVVLRNRAPLRAPDFGPATAPAHTSTSPTGIQAPPTLGSAATSAMVGSAATSAMVGSSTALQDAIAAVRELKRFDGKGQPIPKAEYRFYFLQATQGLADKEIAKLWVNNIEYKSPAHVWLDTLRNDPQRKDSVEKWSTLQPEIEKHWPSPPLDFDAQRDAYRRDWDEHRLDLQTLKEEIESGKAGTQPLQAWAEEHKTRARNVNSTDEDRVSKTIRVNLHDGWLVNLLPKRDGYYDKFDDLMKDIAAISLRSLIAGWEQESVVTSMRSMSVSLESSPYTLPSYSRPSARPSNTSWQPLAPPQTPARSSTPRRQNTPSRGVSFSPLVQVSQPEAPPPPPQPLPRAPRAQDEPPHMPGPPAPPTTPQTPAGPVESVASRAARSGQPPVGATLIPDTPEARTQWRQRQQEWLNTHGQVWPELDKPYPLTPGTYEPTAPIEESLGNLERNYRKKVRNALRDQRRAGSQPSTPTPGQRYRETNQVEFSEPESEPESMGYLSGNE